MNKYIRFLIIFLVLLFSIGLVSATEENNMITEDVIEVEEINDLNVETINEEESIKNAAGDVHNFTWLNEKIYENNTDDATIDLEESTVKWNGTALFTNGITINKTVTIKNGIIDGNNNVRIFNVTSIGNLILHDVVLVNGTADYGGAIHNNGGNVTIKNGSFTDNTATINGGVIYNYEGNITINNGFFTNNNATSANGGGGVIYSHIGDVTIYNGSFTNNNASNGGVIYNTFGGSITIGDGIFTNNTAIANGGIIYNEYGTVNIENGNFTDNNASLGAVIYNTIGASITISDGIFTNNTAISNGGVIYNEGIINIENGNFTDNGAYIGAVIYNTISGIIDISDGNFTNNNATNNASVFYNDGNFNLNNTYISSSVNNYLIYNNITGVLFLFNNIMINPSNIEKVFNNGNITSMIVLRIMNNDTVSGTPGNNVILNATLKDDSNNTIVGQNITLNNSTLGNIILSYFENGVYNTSYNPLNIGTFLINGSYLGGDNLTIEMGLLEIKINTNINVTVDNVTFDESVIIGYDLTPGAAGLISVIIKDSDNNTPFSDIITVGSGVSPDLGAGEYTVFLTYFGNDIYKSSSNFTTFTIYKASTSIVLDVSNITFGDNLTVDYLVNSNVVGISGNVTIIVRNLSGVVYNKTFMDTGNITEIPYLNAGNYLLNITYNGNANYSKSSIVQPFTVYKASTSIVLDVSNITFGDNLTVDYLVNSNAVSIITGNVTIIVRNSSSVVYNKTFLDTGNITEIPNLNIGNYLLNITYNGDDNYNKSSIVQPFTVYKAITNIVLDVNNITFGDNLTVDYSVISNVVGIITGNVTIIIKDSFNVIYNRTFLNLSDIIIIPNLNAGEYNISVMYNGDDNYLNSSFTNLFEVFRISSNLIFNVTNVTYGEYPFITINLTTTNGDLLNTTIMGRIYGISLNLFVFASFNLIDGYYEGFLSNWGNLFFAGTYSIMLEYYGDNYEDAFNETIFEVFKADIIVNITEENMVYDGNQTIKINVDPDLCGNITLIYNSKEIEVPVNNTEAIFSDLGLNPGSHNITIYYPGNMDYNDYNQTIIVTISKRDDNNLAIKDSEIVYSNNETIVLTANLELTGNLTIIIENETSNVPIINGTIIISGLNLPVGNYSLEIIYLGDDNFNDFNNTFNFTVIKANVTLTIVDTNIIASDNQTLLANINSDATGNLTLTINGTEYVAPIINGNVTFLINDLNIGTYNGTITYAGDNNYKPLEYTFKFNIISNVKSDVILNASNIIMFYRDGTRYVVILTDTLSNPISDQTIYITVNGVTYKRSTNENGTTYLNINLFPKEYSVTAYYNGSDKYNNASITTKLTINSNIITEDFVKYYKNNTQYSVIVLDDKYNPLPNQTVEYNINGVKYPKTTDNKGISILSINLFPGNYTITTTYNGLSQSNNIEVLPTLIAKNLTKNFGASDQYEVNVFDGMGKPLSNQDVKVNIHGLVYDIFTDSNGTGRLNINLDPGSYIATSTWDAYSTSNIINVI